MNTHSAAAADAAPWPSGPLSPLDQIRYAREIVRLEAHALFSLAERLGNDFNLAVDCLFNCPASVIVTGMGKAGLVGQKIAATLTSTGTRSHFLHPAEALHGDLGRIHRDDVVLILSQSGETEEILRLLPPLLDLGVTLLAITAHRGSTLARAATVVVELGPLKEACSLGLAPSTSTTAMLALGDALALVTSRMRDFGPADFARFHPGGSLGRRLSKVEEHLRPVETCRVALDTESVRAVLSKPAPSGRRSGAIMLLNAAGLLSGIFTDSDLARLFESRRDNALDEPIDRVMTPRPITVPAGSMVTDALAIMAERKLSELPVVDPAGRPLGLLDITDLVSRDLAADSAASTSAAPSDFARPSPSTISTVPRPKHLDRRGTWRSRGA
ncbi:MAG: KpsF/GutQ family sugar-phosphate isomerase [Planctomycetia bacterium]|nr:KpsF/GutQ family sugar-phosphate isomerase [Planctomycetia bacterium]